MAPNPPLPIPAELAVDDEPFTLDELDESLADTTDEVADLRPRRWRVEDDGAAEWAMRHLAVVEQDAADVETQATAWVERIAEWQARATRPLQTRAAFFRAHLEDYALRRREADPRAKSLTLPSGVVRTRVRGGDVVVADETALIAWAHEHLGSHDDGLVVKVVESVRVSELRKLVTVVEVPDSVTMSCGCSITTTDPVALGAGVICPSCGDTAQVVKWHDVRAVVMHGDVPVPGVAIADATVAATVTAEAP